MDLYLHGQKLESVFELLGTKENDITYSVGWAMGRCPKLMEAVLDRVGLSGARIDKILLQEHGQDKGFSDIELIGETAHVIIEAKRGWWLPDSLQWGRYASRFEQEQRPHRRFLAMSDCSQDWAKLHLRQKEHGIPLHYLGWRDLAAMAERVGGSNAEKRLLGELHDYLQKVATMQKLDTNWV